MNPSLEAQLDALAFDAVGIRKAAQLMTAIESDQAVGDAVLARLRDQAMAPLLLGITGTAGVGKSTLVAALIDHWRKTQPDHHLGIVAVDPSSPRTSGALLGDRVRMMRHATDANVFIRSMASRGQSGGLARATRAVAGVMQLLNCQPTVIETVGVGQTEVEIAAAADRTLLVVCPGSGDGVQWLKSGLMEIGDAIVINKADRPEAQQLKSELESTMHLAHRDTPIVLVSAQTGEGIADLADLIATWQSPPQSEKSP